MWVVFGELFARSHIFFMWVIVTKSLCMHAHLQTKRRGATGAMRTFGGVFVVGIFGVWVAASVSGASPAVVDLILKCAMLLMILVNTSMHGHYLRVVTRVRYTKSYCVTHHNIMSLDNQYRTYRITAHHITTYRITITNSWID